jgi:hypothetical protein
MLPLLTRHPVDWQSFFSILLEHPSFVGFYTETRRYEFRTLDHVSRRLNPIELR